MLFNLIMIGVILALAAFVIYHYVSSVSNDTETIDENDYSDIETIKNKVAHEFSAMLKQDLRDKNMSKQEYEAKEKQKAALRRSLKDAANGDAKAKKYIKTYIMQMLVDENMHLNINEETIDEIIPFNEENRLSGRDKFEIVLYIAYNYMCDDTGKPYKQNGFARVVKDYHLTDPVKINDEWSYDFTKERLNAVYHDLTNRYELNYKDKLTILAQRVFANYKGLGPVDALFETGLDEIDGGLSGIPKDGFDISNSSKDLTFSYQSIWVMIGGVKLRLSCIAFDSQEELIRVVNNIYKYGANRVLSRKSGYVISTMKNGARVVVFRPPFANTWAFLARKFDSTPSIAPEDLIKGNNAIIPLTLLKWLIKGQRNIGITGSQGTGKSTMLKSLIRFINPSYSIRVQEKAAELNLNYTYPNRNIVAFQETESIGSQEGLNLQKKTSGDVNIIGEVAEAIQANFVVQTAMVASLFAMFTHHAKTTYDYVTAIANNLLDPECGIYREKKEAVEMAAKILHIDVHLENRNKHRFIERITEVIPVRDTLYPSEQALCEYAEEYKHKAEPAKELELIHTYHEKDELEFWKRQTDREQFTENRLMHYENGEFVLDHLPSPAMMADIESKLSEEEKAQFRADMKMIDDLPRRKVTTDVFTAKPAMLDPDLYETEPVES